MPKKDNKPVRPMIDLHRALKAAPEGVMPPFSSETLISSLGLEGEEPDGRTLMERFAGNPSLSPVVLISILRAFVGLKKPLNNLIEATNERTANPAQEAIAQSLGAVVTRQVEREGEICGLVSDWATSSTREDIIPREVRLMIAEPEAES